MNFVTIFFIVLNETLLIKTATIIGILLEMAELPETVSHLNNLN